MEFQSMSQVYSCHITLECYFDIFDDDGGIDKVTSRDIINAEAFTIPQKATSKGIIRAEALPLPQKDFLC